MPRPTIDSFEYDDNGKPYLERNPHSENKARYTSIPDRERGALKRLQDIMDGYQGFSYFVQTDPRGASLYISAEPGLTGENYNSGIAVYK